MRRIYTNVIIGIIAVTFIVLGLAFKPPVFSQLQKETGLILLIICGSSALYCFIVGEISKNNSQMDKLWSILPIVYTWLITIKSDFNIRCLLISILTTLWGIRLTYNFARKGAYKIKFWSGEEDYRWEVLRETKPFNNKFVWALFNLFFISIYQNIFVLLICIPSLEVMESTSKLVAIDYISIILSLLFLFVETLADIQQMHFHTIKKQLLQKANLDKLPYPYNLGFNTTGIWKYAAHPNYLGEQGFWISIYLFTISSNVNNFGVFNYSILGSMLLVLLFLGSSTFAENISSKKYDEYKKYLSKVTKYIPLIKYKR